MYCIRENSDLQLVNNSLFYCVCGVLAHFTFSYSEHVNCQRHKTQT